VPAESRLLKDRRIFPPVKPVGKLVQVALQVLYGKLVVRSYPARLSSENAA